MKKIKLDPFYDPANVILWNDYRKFVPTENTGADVFIRTFKSGQVRYIYFCEYIKDNLEDGFFYDHEMNLIPNSVVTHWAYNTLVVKKDLILQNDIIHSLYFYDKP